MIGDKAPTNKRLRRGAIIRLQADDKNNWRITQMPEVEAAFLSLDPQNGAVRALVGGFDFNRSKFNHATQAWRQPGSSFKPFIYSSALENGFMPDTTVLDAPITFPTSVTGGKAWSPKNYDGRYEGFMPLRTALSKSKNMVSIRLMDASGISFVQNYVTRFGFDSDKQPPYLTTALGAGSVTAWQMVGAYSIFANGGYRIQPYIVRRITDDKEHVLAEVQPTLAGDESLQVITPRNAFLMDSMLRGVTIYGTAARASATLKRRDLAGKTGTTNEHVDAWFCGYQRTVVACSWTGFDQPKSLGGGETGGSVSLPAWIGYMAKVLKDVPESFMPTPPDAQEVVNVSDGTRGPGKGELAQPSEEESESSGDPALILEQEFVPDPSAKPTD